MEETISRSLDMTLACICSLAVEAARPILKHQSSHVSFSFRLARRQIDNNTTFWAVSDHMKVADIISKRVNNQKVNPKEITLQRIRQAKEDQK